MATCRKCYGTGEVEERSCAWCAGLGVEDTEAKQEAEDFWMDQLHADYAHGEERELKVPLVVSVKGLDALPEGSTVFRAGFGDFDHLLADKIDGKWHDHISGVAYTASALMSDEDRLMVLSVGDKR